MEFPAIFSEKICKGVIKKEAFVTASLICKNDICKKKPDSYSLLISISFVVVALLVTATPLTTPATLPKTPSLAVVTTRS